MEGVEIMFEPRWVPCPDCRRTYDRMAAEPHVCRPVGPTDILLRELRAGIDAFDADLAKFLDSTQGRLESWGAARQVRESRHGRR